MEQKLATNKENIINIVDLLDGSYNTEIKVNTKAEIVITDDHYLMHVLVQQNFVLVSYKIKNGSIAMGCISEIQYTLVRTQKGKENARKNQN